MAAIASLVAAEMGERAANITDFNAVPHEKPLPLEHQLDGNSGVVTRDDSASGKIAFMENNAKLDVEHALPGGGTNSNGSWVRLGRSAGIQKRLQSLCFTLQLLLVASDCWYIPYKPSIGSDLSQGVKPTLHRHMVHAKL